MIKNDWGLLTWPNQDDQMNMTESWQRQTLTIEFDQNWQRRTTFNLKYNWKTEATLW